MKKMTFQFLRLSGGTDVMVGSLSQMWDTYCKSISFWFTLMPGTVQFLVMHVNKSGSCYKWAFPWDFCKRGTPEGLLILWFDHWCFVSASPAGVWGDVCCVSAVGCVHCALHLPSHKKDSQVAVLERCLFVPPAPCWWKVSSLAQPDKTLDCSWVKGCNALPLAAGWSFKSEITTSKLLESYCVKGLIYLFLPSLGPLTVEYFLRVLGLFFFPLPSPPEQYTTADLGCANCFSSERAPDKTCALQPGHYP